MKKIFIPAIIALSIATVSCRKERTCECKTTATEVRSGFGAQTTTDVSQTKVTTEKQRKRPFKYSEHCFSDSYSYNNDGGNGPSAWSSVTTVETECDLK
ncbi:MAG: hypothetical protein JNJ41_19555 [Bacteroidia bacterium]|nr:hypothetical protein [Bacteroidia bacterium]